MTPLAGLGSDVLSFQAPLPGQGVASSSSWERAFQRALTPNWFHGPLGFQGERSAAHGLRPLPVSIPAAPASPPPAPDPAAVRAAAVGISMAAGGRGALPSLHGVWLTSLARPPQGAAHFAAPEPAHVSSFGTEPCESSPSSRANARTPHEHSGSSGVHVHAEAAKTGLCIWLGIAGDAQRVAACSRQLLEALRRQADGSGQRLAAVICNGQPILHAQAAADSAIQRKDIP